MKLAAAAAAPQPKKTPALNDLGNLPRKQQTRPSLDLVLVLVLLATVSSRVTHSNTFAFKHFCHIAKRERAGAKSNPSALANDTTVLAVTTLLIMTVLITTVLTVTLLVTHTHTHRHTFA